MTWSRRQFLASTGAATLLAPFLSRSAHAAGTPATKLVVVFCRGAWDVTYCFDPRGPDDAFVDGPWRRERNGPVDTSSERIAEVGTLRYGYNDTPGTRPEISKFFSEWGDLSLIINGMSSGTIVHDLARERILTGSRVTAAPDLAAIFGANKQGNAPVGYMDFAGQGFVGPYGASASKVGSRGQLELLLDPALEGVPGPKGASWDYPLYAPGEEEVDAIAAWLAARENRLRTAWDDGEKNSDLLDLLAASRTSAEELMLAAPEITPLIELGRTMDIGAQTQLAVDLLQGDLCKAVLIDSDLPWDTHTDNFDQNDNFNDLFTGLNGLAEALGRQSLQDDVLVVVLSEFTRTPKLNADDGKDHWPVISTLMFGAGIQGGRTIGQTNESLGAMPVDLATGEVDENDGVIPDYSNLIAGILSATGVDPSVDLPRAEPYTAIQGS